MARVKQLADKDGEPIYPVVDPTQLHFSGTQNDTVNGDGSIRSTYETNRKINFSAYGGTAIAENANLNTVTYNKVGKFFCASSPKAATLTNCPTSVAFTMEVSSAFNDSIDDESTGTWVYRKRIITDAYGYIWIQMNHSKGTVGAFSYGAWERITTNSGNAKNSTYLEGNGRIASADIAHQYDNDQVHQRLDISSSSMTTGRPAADGFINTYSWDNSGSYDTQVYIPNGETINKGMPQIRFKNNAANWSSWKNILVKEALLDFVYPVGAIYMSVNNVSPQSFLGGTWQVWGSGRVPVGVDTTQTEFNTVGKTGGEKTHTLSVNEMPQHSHGAYYTGSSSATKSYGWYGTSGNAMAYDLINAGGNQAHNNLQPYITCYMWKRTA